MKHKITIYLKSGIKIDFICEDFEMTWSKVTGEYLSYSIKGLVTYKTISLDIDEIAAFTSEEQPNE